MTAITISLSDERVAELREKATRLGIRPEDLVRASIDELLSEPDEALEKAMAYVLQKNTELYRRLA